MHECSHLADVMCKIFGAIFGNHCPKSVQRSTPPYILVPLPNYKRNSTKYLPTSFPRANFKIPNPLRGYERNPTKYFHSFQTQSTSELSTCLSSFSFLFQHSSIDDDLINKQQSTWLVPLIISTHSLHHHQLHLQPHI